MGVNQLREINDGRAVSRLYRLPLEHFEVVGENDPPAHDLAWYDLPDGFLLGITLAAKFVGSRPSFPEQQFICHVHVHNGRVYATDHKLAVEIDVGVASRSDFSLTPRQVKAVAAFGSSPNQCAETDRTVFRWLDGRCLFLPKQPGNGQKVASFFDRFEWGRFKGVPPSWAEQITGHFSFRVAREQEGILEISDGSIKGGVFDQLRTVDLRTDTFTDRTVEFEREAYLKGIKYAREVKFVHEDDHSALLFRGECLRGLVLSRARGRK